MDLLYLQPLFHIVKGLLVCDIVDNDDAVGSSEVGFIGQCMKLTSQLIENGANKATLFKVLTQ